MQRAFLFIAAMMLVFGQGFGAPMRALAESDAADDAAAADGTEEVSEEDAGGGGPLDSNDGVVEMPMLVAPVTVNGRLHYYAFMQVKLEAANFDGALLIREKVAFIQDGFLREVHRASIALNGDPKTIDGEGLKRRLMLVCDSVLGPGVVINIKFGETAEAEESADAGSVDAGSHGESAAAGGH